jgi:hypothetical protein
LFMILDSLRILLVAAIAKYTPPWMHMVCQVGNNLINQLVMDIGRATH